MSYRIYIGSKAEEWLERKTRTDIELAQKIMKFIKENLAQAQDPSSLLNAKRIRGYKDNRYKWRLGNYQIIGSIQNDECKIMQIIKRTKIKPVEMIDDVDMDLIDVDGVDALNDDSCTDTDIESDVDSDIDFESSQNSELQ